MRVENYLPLALRVARRSLCRDVFARRDPHVSESIAIDALADAVLSCKPGDNLGGLITVVTRRHVSDWKAYCVAQCRDARRTVHLDTVAIIAPEPCGLCADDRDAIWDAVDALPATQAQVIRCRYKDGVSLRDVAKLLGITYSAVVRAEKLAIMALRDRLGPLFAERSIGVTS